MQQGEGQARRAGGHGNQNVKPAHAGEQQHRAADGREQDGLAAVRFDENQTENHGDERAGKNDSAGERVHLPLITVAITGERDDERDFGKFGGLQREAEFLDPAMRAVAGVADVRDKDQAEQEQRAKKNRPAGLFEQLIIQDRRRHAENQTGGTPDELHHQIVQAGLDHA